MSYSHEPESALNEAEELLSDLQKQGNSFDDKSREKRSVSTSTTSRNITAYVMDDPLQ